MTDDTTSCWVIGYGSYWDGYTIGSMAGTYNSTQNKHFVKGWLEAQREDKQNQK